MSGLSYLLRYSGHARNSHTASLCNRWAKHSFRALFPASRKGGGGKPQCWSRNLRSSSCVFSQGQTATLTLVLSGCVSPGLGSKMNRISVGMTKDEVVSILGQPTFLSASAAVEVLNYSMEASRVLPSRLFTHDYTDYFVRLKKGRVKSFGRREDFPSATIEAEP